MSPCVSSFGSFRRLAHHSGRVRRYRRPQNAGARQQQARGRPQNIRRRADPGVQGGMGSLPSGGVLRGRSGRFRFFQARRGMHQRLRGIGEGFRRHRNSIFRRARNPGSSRRKDRQGLHRRDLQERKHRGRMQIRHPPGPVRRENRFGRRRIQSFRDVGFRQFSRIVENRSSMEISSFRNRNRMRNQKAFHGSRRRGAFGRDRNDTVRFRFHTQARPPLQNMPLQKPLRFLHFRTQYGRIRQRVGHLRSAGRIRGSRREDRGSEAAHGDALRKKGRGQIENHRLFGINAERLSFRRQSFGDNNEIRQSGAAEGQNRRNSPSEGDRTVRFPQHGQLLPPPFGYSKGDRRS